MAMSCTTLVSSTLSSTTPRHRRDICRGPHTLGPSSTPPGGGTLEGHISRDPHGPGPHRVRLRLPRADSRESSGKATRNIWF